MLRDHFQQGSVVYYTRDGDLWRAQAWSDDLEDPLLSVLRAGLPNDTPVFRQTLEAGGPVFTDAWDAAQEGVAQAGAYHTVAAYPLFVNGEARHLLSFGLKNARQWSEREMALIRAVGRGLSLVLDRTAQARNAPPWKPSSPSRRRRAPPPTCRS